MANNACEGLVGPVEDAFYLTGSAVFKSMEYK